MTVFVVDRVEFAAKRRGVLDRAETELAPVVEESLQRWGTSGWYHRLLDTVVPQLFAKTFFEETGEREHPNLSDAEQSLHADLVKTLSKQGRPRENSADIVTRLLATATVNAATRFAAETDTKDLILEWVTMHDNEVRTTHRAADGQRRQIGDKFDIGGSALEYPGDPVGPIEEWINCRCVLRPDHSTANSMAAAGNEPVKQGSSVIVALPHPDHPFTQVAAEQPHVTLCYLGDAGEMSDDDLQGVQDATATVANVTAPYTDPVSGRATLGPDKADVLMLDGHNTTGVRNALMAHPAVTKRMQMAGQHPNFIPHATVGYPADSYGDPSDINDLSFDRLALWHGDQQTEYPLGGAMTASATEAADPEAPATVSPVPWHGVLAPMGVKSGDKRMFALGSLRNRDLPLPLTWQKMSGDGHAGSVVVGRIDNIAYEDNMAKASGVMLMSPEADEFVGQLAEFGKFGVSVDVDDASFDLDEASETLTFQDARICSASCVAIPAFAEAYISLGPWGVSPGESQAASGETQTFDRGPGWVTNPVATKRIHDYWTVPGQPGYEKIGWGTDGDFNRCRVELGEEIGENSPDKVRFLNQICAQWQHDAIGVWPGKGEKAALEGEPTESIALVASGGWCAPSEWFDDPSFKMLTPLTIIDMGDEHFRVVGHLAGWDTCHIGFPGTCVVAPHSATNYAYFKTGEVLTDAGPLAVGNISLGGGHAHERLGVRGTLAHYDSTSYAVADVNMGEDEFGPWVAGLLRPGVSEEKRAELRAAALSGDWRRINGNLELVAALAVNVPGFPIPRPAVGVEDGAQLSLVAAGVVERPADLGTTLTLGSVTGTYSGGGGISVGTLTVTSSPSPEFVAQVVEQLKAREARKMKMVELGKRVLGDPKERMAALAARVDGE